MMVFLYLFALIIGYAIINNQIPFDWIRSKAGLGATMVLYHWAFPLAYVVIVAWLALALGLTH
jgi:hypothetical protein